MRCRRPFLPLGKSWMYVLSYYNWNILYLSSTLCRKVYFPFRLCCLYLFRLCGLYRLAWMTFLWTASSFAQLSCCTYQGGAGSVGGSWGIGFPWWWSHSAITILDFHFGCHYTSGKRSKGSALWRPHVWLSVLHLSVQRSFECIAPVPHTPGVPCVVGSRQLLLWRPPLYWTVCNTVDWTGYLA